jgi:hypothetical protein
VQPDHGLDEVRFAGDVQAAGQRRRPWDLSLYHVVGRQRCHPYPETTDRAEPQPRRHDHFNRRIVLDDLAESTQA